MNEADARSPKKTGGRDEAWIARIKAEKAAKETGGAPPSEEPKKTMVPSHLGWIWEGFSDLSRSRDYGEIAPRPIKPSELLAYCDVKMLGGEYREEFYDLVMEMDIHFVSRRTREAEARLKEEAEARKRAAK